MERCGTSAVRILKVYGWGDGGEDEVCGGAGEGGWGEGGKPTCQIFHLFCFF